jgi:hypothetical protein
MQNEPHWFWMLRRVLTFVLGIVVILDSLLEKNEASVGKLVVGLLMIGIPPVDDLVRLIGRNGHKKEPEPEPEIPNRPRRAVERGRDD